MTWDFDGSRVNLTGSDLIGLEPSDSRSSALEIDIPKVTPDQLDPLIEMLAELLASVRIGELEEMSCFIRASVGEVRL